MKFIDMHCDTLMVAFAEQEENMYKMPGMLDLERMQASGQLAQFFAIFMLPEGAEDWINSSEPVEDEEYINFCLQAFDKSMALNSDIIAPALNAEDVRGNEKQGKMSGILTMEDGRPIQGKLENIKYYYARGVRLLTLLWNDENCFGYPNSLDAKIMKRGLKDFGKEAVEYMNELGMLIDVSHLSDGGFWDVASISKQPFVASHSNARALSPHPRNLTDEMLRKIGETGGVAGLNFAPGFLDPDITAQKSRLKHIVEHIHYMINVAGIESVALGSDFDGVKGEFEIAGPQDMPLIFEALNRTGLSDDTIEKIAWKNVLRIMADVL